VHILPRLTSAILIKMEKARAAESVFISHVVIVDVRVEFCRWGFLHERMEGGRVAKRGLLSLGRSKSRWTPLRPTELAQLKRCFCCALTRFSFYCPVKWAFFVYTLAEAKQVFPSYRGRKQNTHLRTKEDLRLIQDIKSNLRAVKHFMLSVLQQIKLHEFFIGQEGRNFLTPDCNIPYCCIMVIHTRVLDLTAWVKVLLKLVSDNRFKNVCSI
jgi:hypothetical protein